MDEETKCIFCGAIPESEHGPHHILPKAVVNTMKWKGKRAQGCISQYTVPICGSCHRKLNLLLEPLIKMIKYLRATPPVPAEFMFVLDGAYLALTKQEGDEND